MDESDTRLGEFFESRHMAGGTKLIAENRRARHDYHLLERYEAGIALTGTEVKSLRAGRADLARAFADVRDGEVWLMGAHIDEYAQGTSPTTSPTATESFSSTAKRSTPSWARRASAASRSSPRASTSRTGR